MPKFNVVGRDTSGNRVEKTVEANDREAAAAVLRRTGMAVQNVEAVGGGFDLNKLFGGGEPAPKIKGEGLVIFTRQFATMIGAGIPVMECLDILAEQADDPGFKNALYKICNDVRTGTDLSSALGRHPKCFPDIYVNMIRAGEASGQLDVILVRLAEFMEAGESLKRKIKSAMTYPVISLVMILGITTFLLLVIIPQFEKIFKELGVPLPLPTRIVLGVSQFMQTYWYIMGAAIGGGYFGLAAFKKTPRGRYLWDSFMLNMPVFGNLNQKVAVSRFARTFSTLLRSGVAILAALEIVSSTAGNAVLEEAILASREAIRNGETLAKPLADSPIFPPMVVCMIQVGEKSGALETLLEKISEFYDEQVDALVESLTSLIEPLMIGLMGAIVGGIVLAIFLPIFDMQKSIGGKK